MACGPKYISPTDPPFNAKVGYNAGDLSQTADQTAAWQAAIDAWLATEDAILLLPPGPTRIDGTLVIRNAEGRIIQGHGTQDTVIYTTGAHDDRDVVLIYGSNQLVLRDFGMHLSPRRSGICQGRLSDLLDPQDGHVVEGGRYNGFHTFTNIEIRPNEFEPSAPGTRYQYGFFWTSGTSTAAPRAFVDANNDLNSLYDCNVLGYRTAGYFIGHSQSKHHRFLNCKFSGSFGLDGQGQPTMPRDALHCGVLMTRGSFRFTNGGGGANAGADFIVCAANDNIVIEGVDSEGSNRFVRIGGDLTGTMPGASGAPYPVTVRNNRYAGNNLATDGVHVSVVQPGPVDISGNTWLGPQPATPFVYYAPLAGGSVRVSYNEWSASNTGQMDQPGQFLYVDSNQHYDHHVECQGNVGRSVTETPAPYRQLPRNLATPYFYQSGVYTTHNTEPTTIRQLVNPLPGCEITIVALDDNTMVRHGLIKLSGSSDWAMPNGASLTLKAVSRWGGPGAPPPAWIETGRMDPTSTPDFGGDDIKRLEYRLGGRGAVVRFWDRRVGVTAVAGKVASWLDARGIGDPLTQADASKRFGYDEVDQSITVPEGGVYNMSAPVPDNPHNVWVPFWVVIFRNKELDPLGSNTILLRTYQGTTLAHSLRTATVVAGPAVVYNWPFPPPSTSVAGAVVPMPDGIDDGIVGGLVPYSSTGASLTAAALSGFAGAFDLGSHLAEVQTPFDSVLVGTDYVDDNEYQGSSYELCAVLALSVIDMAPLMPIITEWAAAYHWTTP
jgi:hypothetical protein